MIIGGLDGLKDEEESAFDSAKILETMEEKSSNIKALFEQCGYDELIANVAVRLWHEKKKELKRKGLVWIGVEDEKPEPFVSVQVYMPGEAPCQTVREGFITNDGVWHAGLFDREPGEVTHWKPMSEPPNGRSTI